MQHFHSILTISTVSKGEWDAYDLIGWDDQKVRADDAAIQGVALHPSSYAGMDMGLMVLGWVRVKASGAIVKGDPVMTAAGGGVKKALSTAKNAFAIALTAAADGEFVDILIR